MKKSIMAIALASSISLSACATNDRMAGNVAEGAAYGAAGGAVVGAVRRICEIFVDGHVGAGFAQDFQRLERGAAKRVVMD